MLSEWERSDTPKGIPFYINHKTEKTFWDHPYMTRVYSQLKSFDFIKYAAYRVACKLRSIQKATLLCHVDLKTLRDYLEIRNFGTNVDIDYMITVPELASILEELFVYQARKRNDLPVEPSAAAEFAQNWLLNVYNSMRSQYVSLASVKIGLSLLVFGSVPAKYHYIYSQLKDGEGVLDRARLKMFLASCLLIPKHFGEEAAFGKSGLEPSVQQCLDQSLKTGEVSLDEFMKWVLGGPQMLIWIPTLHRLSVAETTKHEAKCNICKVFPIVGFRYRCLKCFNVDLCQECFWTGRVWKRHKLSHPIQEYCQNSKQSEDVKDVARIVKNKMVHGGKSDRERKKRYMPVSSEDPLPVKEDGEKSFDTESRDYHPVSEATDYYREPPTKDKLGYQRKDSKKSNTSSTKRPSKRESIASAEQGSSEYDGYLRPYDKKTGYKTEHVGPVMMPDQTSELERIIATLERNNSLMEDRLDEMRHRQIDYHSKTTLNEIKSLRDNKALMEARQEVLEDHNRILEMQLLKLRMLLQQGIIDESWLSGLNSGMVRLNQDKSLALVVAPTKIDSRVDSNNNDKTTQPSLQHKLEFTRDSCTQTRNQNLTSVPSAIYRSPKENIYTPPQQKQRSKSREELEFERAVESALADFPTRGKSGMQHPKHRIFESADELSKSIALAISEEIYQYQDV